MSIQHHPIDDTLLRFAAGRLDAGLALVTAAHMQGCPQCRARVRAFEAVGGALLDEMAPAPMALTAFTDVLARLAAEPAAVTVPCPPRQADLALPEGMALPAVLAGCEMGRWTWFGPGVRYSKLRLPWAPDANVMLLRVAPHRAVVTHSHATQELTLVLQGGYSDHTGHYDRGDVAYGDPELVHKPRADAATGCLCFSVWDAAPRMVGPLAPLLNRILPI